VYPCVKYLSYSLYHVLKGDVKLRSVTFLAFEKYFEKRDMTLKLA